MYYLIEQDPNKKEYVVFKSMHLDLVKQKEQEMQDQNDEYNLFCNYFILTYATL